MLSDVLTEEYRPEKDGVMWMNGKRERGVMNYSGEVERMEGLAGCRLTNQAERKGRELGCSPP